MIYNTAAMQKPIQRMAHIHFIKFGNYRMELLNRKNGDHTKIHTVGSFAKKLRRHL